MEMDITNLLIPEDEAKIVKSLNLDLEKLNHYDNLFAQWIASQKHLPQIANSTCRKKFLVWAKLDFEKAKKKFVKYCYNPLTHKEFVCDRVISLDGDLKAFNFGYMIPMPKLTPQGYRVNVCKIFAPDSFDLLQIARFLTMGLDYRLYKDGMVAGEIGIFDLASFKPHHYVKATNPTCFKLLRFGTTNYPYMLKHLLVLNCAPAFEKALKLGKALVPQEFAERIILIRLQEIDKYVPKECLPEEFGGTDKPMEYFKEEWKKLVMHEKDFIAEISEARPIGPIPEECMVNQEEFGIGGSFRKLNLD